MPKILREKQKHLADTLKEATVVTKKLGLLGSPHNNKICKGLAKFIKEQVGLEITEVSYQFIS